MTSVSVLHGHKGPVRDIKVNNSFNIVTMISVRVLHGHKGPVRDIKVNNSFNVVHHNLFIPLFFWSKPISVVAIQTVLY